MKKTRPDIQCSNCARVGHSYKRCDEPQTSYGIICYQLPKTVDDTIKLIVICRKNTIGYMEFLRGKYEVSNEEYICELMNMMTPEERTRILEVYDFEKLRCILGMTRENTTNLNEYNISQRKFNQLLENERLKLELEKKISSIDNSTHTDNRTDKSTHTDNSINVSIVVNCFSNPNVSYITEEYVEKCLKNLQTCIPNMAKKIYMNPQHPENHSIRVTNLQNGFAKVLGNKRWETRTKKAVTNGVLEAVLDVLEEKNGGKSYYEIYERVEDKEFKNKIGSDLILDMYNFDADIDINNPN